MIRYEQIDESVKQTDIHPEEIFKREQYLAKTFVEQIQVTQSLPINPIDNSPWEEELFSKWGFQYGLSQQTWAVHVKNLPAKEVIAEYAMHSELATFRASRAYQDVVTRMRMQLWQSQLEWIEGRIYRYLRTTHTNVVDWGNRLIGWTELFRRAKFVDTYFVHDPLPRFALRMLVKKYRLYV